MIKSFVTSSKPLMFPLPSVIQRRCEVSDPAEGSTHLVPTPPQHGKSTRKRDTQPTTICSTLPMNMAFLWVSSNKYTGVSSREDDIDWHKANTIPIGKQSNKSARRKLGRSKSSRLSCFLITFLTKVPKNGASFSVKPKLLVLSREWMGMGNGGMGLLLIFIDSCGSFPHSLLSTSKPNYVYLKTTWVASHGAPWNSMVVWWTRMTKFNHLFLSVT